MGNIQLTTKDGHSFAAYVSEAKGDAKGGIVIIQEIFGVNHHIRSVCDRYAEAGYTAIAPALFDRIKPGIELEYTEEGVKQGLEYKTGSDDDQLINEIEASANHISSAGKVSVVGYCWGGTLAFLSACKADGIFKAIGYYGGGIAAIKDQKPQIPTLLHFGEEDTGIPMEDVNAVIDARPDVEVHVYPAGHGFNCDARGSYHEESARLALKRTLDFIEGA